MQERHSKKRENMRSLLTMTAGWLDRLRAAIERDGRSLREISMASGASPGYLHSLLNGTRAPTIDKLAAVVSALGISLTYILLGVEMDATAERLLKAWAAYPEEKRAALLELLNAGNKTPRRP
jgi:transcriptional regulator with XRE-family HTH domain